MCRKLASPNYKKMKVAISLYANSVGLFSHRFPEKCLTAISLTVQ
jgi:hypothetical protein